MSQNLNKQKVLHISTLHQFHDNRIFNKECTSLALHFDVHFLVPHIKNEIINNVSIEPLKRIENKWLRLMFSWTVLIKPLLKHKDAVIYHFHDPELIPFFLILSFFVNKKIIYDAHEDYSMNIIDKNWIPNYLRKIFCSFMRFFEKAADIHFDSIISVSEPIINKFNNKNKTIIYNYPILSANPTEPYSKYYPNHFTVAYIGVISKDRGCDLLINAVNTSNTIKLILAGWIIEDDLKTLILNSENVDYRGIVNSVEIRKIYRSVDLGVYLLQPNNNSNVSLPNKLFDFMEASLPFIISDLPEIKKAVQKYNCGFLVAPPDQKDISNILKGILNNKHSLSEMGKNGRFAVENEYNWDNEAAKLIALYKKLIH